MPCLGGLTRADSTRIHHRKAGRMKLKMYATPSGNPAKLAPLSSRVAFCFSPICPTAPSTASADMKQPFGAKRARSSLLSTSWIDANHGIDGAVYVSAISKNCGSTIPTSVNLLRASVT
jgi:hypothetical protein